MNLSTELHLKLLGINNQDASMAVQLLLKHILSRITSIIDPTPAPEQYSEILPKRPGFSRDDFLQRVIDQNPILIQFLSLIAENGNHFIVLKFISFFSQ